MRLICLQPIYGDVSSPLSLRPGRCAGIVWLCRQVYSASISILPLNSKISVTASTIPPILPWPFPIKTRFTNYSPLFRETSLEPGVILVLNSFQNTNYSNRPWPAHIFQLTGNAILVKSPCPMAF